ncbi:cytochrome b2 [Schizosaccharomyces japonicus yFS275]|uniref:Cytochrome b2 n=1 Tax=Schizosaccharomyces japonicus (strain yFS275 / FY16936) TaxID=402676 RepID=B6K1N0_SCHJY|nr:cytochrome b2 [Schizosaccharomyces japonicus yFS275]EEB07061.1 cytochrome b2 [Schizosaccharomyces japonicus yFS275]
MPQKSSYTDIDKKYLPWSVYQEELYEMGLHDKKPPFTTVFDEWQPLAKERLSETAYCYAAGSAGRESTERRNTEALGRVRFIPHMLTPKASTRNLEIELFGVKYPTPILVAPIGVQRLYHSEGEVAAARAASKLGIPYIMSSASSSSMEQVAQASGDGPRWFQLYWPEDPNVTVSMLEAATAAGFRTLVVTLDTWNLSWRPRDLKNAYVPFYHGVGDQVCNSTEAFLDKMRSLNLSPKSNPREVGKHWVKHIFPGSQHGWDEINLLRRHWKGPIILKGIQHVDDAKKAVEYGLDGIIVSNHGGRQFDGGIGSIEALEPIVDAVGDKLTVLFDSGVRSGVDVMRALALGAKAVLIGRPFLWGLSLAGTDGVVHVLRCIMADLDLNMGLAGYHSIKELTKKDVYWKV